MKKIIVMAAMLIAANMAKAQIKVIFKDTFQLKDSFTAHVKKIMKHYYKLNSDNPFFTINSIKEPLLVSNDSIIYDVKFITQGNGACLWGTTVKFYNLSDSVSCEITDIRLVKQRAYLTMNYLNTSVDDMQQTRATKFILAPLKRRVSHFFSMCGKVG